MQRSEDAAYTAQDFQFLPGEYLYFTFRIAGFATAANGSAEGKSFSLDYEVVPRDEKGVPLAPSDTGKIAGDLNAEDKNWTPKRRASFLLPSYVAAGKFFVHVAVRDLVAKTQTVSDYPFLLGGEQILPALSIEASGFEFLRNEEDAVGLELPAYAPGDTVWARFNMNGFKLESKTKYRLTYALKVLRPDGKIFLDEPNAARISSESFYPAQFVPAGLQITTPKDAQHGSYLLALIVRDEVADQSFELKRTFTIE